MQFSEKIQQCNLSPIRKFHPYALAAEARGRKIYHLNIGQPDIETPREFFDAILHFQDPVLAYAPSAGIPAYVEAVRSYYHGLGIELDSGDILAAAGGSEALQIVMQCILDEGDEVIIPEPFYPNYNTFIRLAGGSIHPIPTTPEEGFFYGARERVEAQITPHTRAILVTNPGNPTGAVLTPESARVLADVARDHGLFLIADEVYREFIYGDEKTVSLAEFEDVRENVVIIDSISKRFSACGARIGALISRNKELMAQAMKICQAGCAAPRWTSWARRRSTLWAWITSPPRRRSTTAGGTPSWPSWPRSPA
jgi:aspartate aminotransferase